MRILHIGDFHFRSNKNQYDQRNIVSKFINHLKGKSPIDILLFSGDLVFNGAKEDDFKKAHETLFIPLIAELGIKENQIFICSGNHDIDRNESSQAIIDFFTNPETRIKNNQDLSKWTETNKKDLEISLLSGKNYFNYATNNFSKESETFNEFITIHKRFTEDKKVAVVTINSSWLCSGFKQDHGNLLFPIDILKNAISQIQDCVLKILMVHHPLHYFKEFNSNEIQDLIHKEFNLMFDGHVHKERIETDFNSKNGIYCNTTQATLCFDNCEIGYSLLNINLEDINFIKLERGHFINKENSFIDLEPVMITIPCGEEKFKQNRLRNKIIAKFEIELEISNQLLLNYDEEGKRSFLETFTNPVLSTRSDAESSSGNPEYNFDYSELSKIRKP